MDSTPTVTLGYRVHLRIHSTNPIISCWQREGITPILPRLPWLLRCSKTTQHLLHWFTITIRRRGPSLPISSTPTCRRPPRLARGHPPRPTAGRYWQITRLLRIRLCRASACLFVSSTSPVQAVSLTGHL